MSCARTSVAEVIRGATASEALLLACSDAAFSRMTASTALDAFDSAQVPNLPGVSSSGLLEIERHLNAFAIRARLAAIEGHPSTANPTAKPPEPAQTVEDVRPQHARPPDEVLSQTTLREVIFWSAGAEALRRRLGKSLRSPLMDATASDFLADDEAEERYREVLDTHDYLELAELVSAFTLTLHRDWALVR